MGTWILAVGRPWYNSETTGSFAADLAIDLVALIAIVAFIYYPDRRDKEHAFMLVTLNVVVFVVAHLLSRIDLGVGFAFGLFALFGILRYRTEAVPVRDMSYLFAVIALGLINSVGQSELTYVDLMIANGLLVGVLGILTHLWWPRSAESHELLYERIDNIRPENRAALLGDLQARTGLDVTDVEVKSINFLNDTAMLRVFYSGADGSRGPSRRRRTRHEISRPPGGNGSDRAVVETPALPDALRRGSRWGRTRQRDT